MQKHVPMEAGVMLQTLRAPFYTDSYGKSSIYMTLYPSGMYWEAEINVILGLKSSKAIDGKTR